MRRARGVRSGSKRPGLQASARLRGRSRAWARVLFRRELVPRSPASPLPPHGRAARPRPRDAALARPVRDAALRRAGGSERRGAAGDVALHGRWPRSRGRRPRIRVGADPLVRGEVRVGVLRPLPRGGRIGSVVRRPTRVPDGSRQRARGAPRMRARSRRGRGRAHHQAGASVPRRHPRRARGVRRADRGVQRVGRVRDGEGGGARRLARRASGSARVADGDQARRRRSHHQLLDQRSTFVALTTRSDLYRRALELIPGGVNSPVRAMRAVGLDEPFFVARAEGAYLESADGARYLDWVMSWGPLIFGHADPETVEAVRAAAERGTSFGAPTEAEVELAAEIADAVPSVEKVRLVSSGTEAAMSAVRLARAFTARDRIIKFAGCYHGHVDALLASAGSGLATLGIPSTPGVPTAVTSHTVVCPYNDVDATAAAVAQYGEGLAAISVEPVAGNMGVIPPARGFLEALRDLCDASGALLIFDAVLTGF